VAAELERDEVGEHRGALGLRGMRRALALGCLLALVFLSTAEANAKPAEVEVGRVSVTAPVHGRSALLVSVSYPIALVGHRLDLRVSMFRGAGGLRQWDLRPLASGGVPRTPERRRRFTFVHRIDLDRELTGEIHRAPLVRVEASGALDANGDGKPELDSTDVSAQVVSGKPARRPLCTTVPQLRAKPGHRVVARLPACTSRRDWHIELQPKHGSARVRGGLVIYRSAAKFRGTDSLRLSSGSPVVFKVGTGSSAVVRALGDSVTAGFGYYDDGSSMPLEDLLECKPGAMTYDDACSSNSAIRSNKAKEVEYAPDYGLANNVSWAAQWANAHGVTNFENLAVSGSEPSDWAPEGQLYATTKRIEAEGPDYILLTLGANPLLSNMLFGIEEMGCAISADIFGGYRECIEEAFEGVHLRASLKSVYSELVAKTQATIFLMQYHLAIPATALAYSATQIAEMGKLMNREIASVAAEVSTSRLQVVAPPHFTSASTSRRSSRRGTPARDLASGSTGRACRTTRARTSCSSCTRSHSARDPSRERRG
jgi:hypothetical protein